MQTSTFTHTILFIQPKIYLFPLVCIDPMSYEQILAGYLAFKLYQPLNKLFANCKRIYANLLNGAGLICLHTVKDFYLTQSIHFNIIYVLTLLSNSNYFIVMLIIHFNPHLFEHS